MKQNERVVFFFLIEFSLICTRSAQVSRALFFQRTFISDRVGRER